MAFSLPHAPESSTNILSLPAELITHICSFDEIDTNDIFNLAASCTRFNEILFHEENSILWKVKFAQKYSNWTTDEFGIIINEQNTWKDELIKRMNMNKAIADAVKQLESNFICYKRIPYSLFPFIDEFNANNESRSFYIFRATLDYYKNLLPSKREVPKLNVLYSARIFLIYVCQLYFGHEINNFSNLPLTEQTIERGIYLLSYWWRPTHGLSYYKQSRQLDTIALKVCDQLRLKNPHHPIFMNENYVEFVMKNGKSNIDHDLYNKGDAMIVLECINNVLFDDMKLLCSNFYTRTSDCYLLNKVLENKKGSTFLLSVLYESIARRLGILVKLIPYNRGLDVFWTSSWIENEHVDNEKFFIDVYRAGLFVKTEINHHDISDDRYSVSKLYKTFNGLIEEFFFANECMSKFTLDFQKYLNPEDYYAKWKYCSFYVFNEQYPYPLFGNTLWHPLASNYRREETQLYQSWRNIFPSVPNKRSKENNPKYSIGMMVAIIPSFQSYSIKLKKEGIIVGWKNMPDNQKMDTITTYYVLLQPEYSYTLDNYHLPEIVPVMGKRPETLRRLMLLNYDVYFSLGKFFKRFDSELCIFEPIDELARRYPDDHAYAVSKMTGLGY